MKNQQNSIIRKTNLYHNVTSKFKSISIAPFHALDQLINSGITVVPLSKNLYHQLYTERNFINNFKILTSSFKDFGFLLDKLLSKKKNPFLLFKHFVLPGSPSFFDPVIKSFESNGIHASEICPKISKEEVRNTISQNIGLYCSHGDYSFFGNSKVDLQILAKAVSKTTKEFFSGYEIQPVSLDSVIEIIFSKKTSSGLPLFIKKDEIDQSHFKTIFLEFINDFTFSKFLSLGTMIALRHQVREKDIKSFSVKTRIIMVVDSIFLTTQACLFMPLLNTFSLKSKHVGFASNYFEPIDLQRRIFEMRRLAKEQDCNLLNVDFSKFDTSIKPYLKLSFFIACFPFCSIQAPLFGGYANFSLIYWSTAMFSLFQPLYVYKNTAVIASGSTISGEYITAFANTFIHLLVLNYYSIKYNLDLNVDATYPDVIIQGDDGLYTTKKINLKLFSKTCKDLGLNISSDSLEYDYLSNKLFYLGRYFDKYSRPYQTRNWYVSHSIMPGNYNPAFPMYILKTLRNYAFCLDYSNSWFAVKLLSKGDPTIQNDIEMFIQDPDYMVDVKDIENTVFKYPFIKLVLGEQFQKFNLE